MSTPSTIHDRLDLSWQEARNQAVAAYWAQAREVARFIAYAAAAGSANAAQYYRAFAKLLNGAVGANRKDAQPPGRDGLSRERLLALAWLETLVGVTLAQEMDKHTEYHEIYRLCRERVKALAPYLPVAKEEEPEKEEPEKEEPEAREGSPWKSV